MNAAVLNQNNIVENIVCVDTLESNMVPLTNGGIGWVYDPINNTFTPPPKTEEDIRREKQQDYDTAIAAGFEYNGITLLLTDHDRNQFTQLLSLLKEGIELGQLSDNTIIKISDINGQLHNISVIDFRKAMFAYGMHFKTLWDTYN